MARMSCHLVSVLFNNKITESSFNLDKRSPRNFGSLFVIQSTLVTILENQHWGVLSAQYPLNYLLITFKKKEATTHSLTILR